MVIGVDCVEICRNWDLYKLKVLQVLFIIFIQFVSFLVVGSYGVYSRKIMF